MGRRALVLGAGGQAANAWETGLIAGLADAGVDLRQADLLIGTSAGARVALQLASGRNLAQLFQEQLQAPQIQEPMVSVDFRRWREQVLAARTGSDDPSVILRRIGAMALSTPRGDEEGRRKYWEAQVPGGDWPDRNVQIVTVDTESGARQVFDRDSGISTLDAAMASGAVAGIRPPVKFMDRLYMDGGFYSITNADLATDYERVLILTLRAGVPPLSIVSLETELRILKSHARAVEVIYPDDESETAFSSGKSFFDPAIRNPSVIAGRAQGGGRSLRDRVHALWS